MNQFLFFIKNIFQKTVDLLARNTLLSIVATFSFFVIIFSAIYMILPVLSSGDDHYFHFRFAEQLFQNGFFDTFRNFHNIYFTKVAQGEHFLYYNFFFYLTIIPFTFVSPLFLGIKLFAIFSVSFIGTIFYYLFKKLNIKYSFLWAIGFFAVIGVGSFWRLFLSRPFVLSPLIVLLLILAIHKKKYFWVFFLSFIYLFWHTSTFLIPLAVAFVYFIATILYERKYEWKILIFSTFGIILSVLTAFFIDNGFFIHLKDNVMGVLASIFDKKVTIGEGNEVYPKNIFDVLHQNVFMILMFLFAGVVYVLNYFSERKYIQDLNYWAKKIRMMTLTLFLFSALFLVLIQIVSGRFADFFLFFAWIFIVLVFSKTFSSFNFNELRLKRHISVAVIVCLIYLFSNNLLQLKDMFAGQGSRPQAFYETGKYLSENLKEGEIVFNANWSWFPQLYYYAPKQYYVAGLEPKLFYKYSPRLYWLWVNIGKGYVCEIEKCSTEELEKDRSFRNEKLFKEWYQSEGDKIAGVVVKDFQSHYIVSSDDYGYLNSILDRNKNFEKVVDNSYNGLFLYKIKSE